jgi:hypothetical protein
MFSTSTVAKSVAESVFETISSDDVVEELPTISSIREEVSIEEVSIEDSDDVEDSVTSEETLDSATESST